jgi:hypothetical protein
MGHFQTVEARPRQSLLLRPYDHNCLPHFAKSVAKLLAIALSRHAQDEEHDQWQGHSHLPECRRGEFFIPMTPLQFGYPTFHGSHHFTLVLRAGPLILSSLDLGQDLVLVALYDFYGRVHDVNTSSMINKASYSSLRTVNSYAGALPVGYGVCFADRRFQTRLVALQNPHPSFPNGPDGRNNDQYKNLATASVICLFEKVGG